MSDGRKYYCFCDSNCKFETMTKEQILATIAQAAEGGLVFDTEAAFITKVKESNAGGFVTFWVGTTAQYNELVMQGKKEPNCYYLKTDDTRDADITLGISQLWEETYKLSGRISDVDSKAETFNAICQELIAGKANKQHTHSQYAGKEPIFDTGKIEVVQFSTEAVEANFYAVTVGKLMPYGLLGGSTWLCNTIVVDRRAVMYNTGAEDITNFETYRYVQYWLPDGALLNAEYNYGTSGNPDTMEFTFDGTYADYAIINVCGYY